MAETSLSFTYGREELLHFLAKVPMGELGRLAHISRLERHPVAEATYVVDRNVNYTNICCSGCRFCAFKRNASSAEAYVLSTEELIQKADKLVVHGGTQLLLQGGLHPGLGLDHACELLRALRNRFPSLTLHAFSPPEVHHFSILGKIPVEEVLLRLKDAGLDSLPGGGAEILVDSVRERLGAKKCRSGEWLKIMEAAHGVGLPGTATMMFGHVETLSDRVEHLLRIRELQERTGGFTAFIPWTFQPGNTGLGGRTVGGVEYLRTLAVSRLALDNVANIQASWLTQGIAIGEVALHFGANDMGGTMMEENVVRATGLSSSISEREIRRAIRRAGFSPVKRDTQYHRLS